MSLVAAIAATALVVAVLTALTTRRLLVRSFASAIGDPDNGNPAESVGRQLAEAEEEVAAAEERSDLLQLSLDALVSGVVIADRSGRVLFRNRPSDEIAAVPHAQVLVEAAVSELLAATSEGKRGEQEVDFFGPPSRKLLVHAAPVTAGDHIVGGLAVIDDITDLHRIDKTRRDFVANLSHELRTPVGAASLLGEMLVDEDDAEVRRQLTSRLLIETERMSVTIDDLLELSRIESNEQTFDEHVGMQALVDEALARNRVAAETKQVEIGAVLPSEEVAMRGNRAQLLAALVNLVENAVKYSSAGDSVSVRVWTDADTVRLTVQDTGRGIPARDLDRIFERFYRVDRSRDSTTGGTGIGLSVVRHVALNHGGTVDVTSSEGEGSTFTLVLPRDQHELSEGAATTHEVH